MGYTKEQQLAIDKEGMNLIVSAGAGSGKTAVLTERVIRKIKSGVDVSRLLVLTFTNEAANEMRERIRRQLIKNKLDSQLALLDSSYITTFDSFALSLVKKYNYLLNVSDNLKIIDSNVIDIYKHKILEDIFLERYGTINFDKLINDFCFKDDKNIRDFILLIYDKLSLVPDKEGYINNYFTSFYSNEAITKNKEKYLAIIKDKILALKENYLMFERYIPEKQIVKYTDWFKPLFGGNSYQEYRLFLSKSSVRFTNIPDEGIKLKETIKGLIGEIKELLRFDSEEDLINNLLTTKDYVSEILDIIKSLDMKVSEYKDDHNVYEFNDISHMAIKLVRDYIDVRNELKNYFNEIMVDEYQDTSDLQEEFISYIGNNNIYMVGDIKQSIYRFRNANPYIFQNKYDAYSKNDGGFKIDLIKNFRSRREVLDGINLIFNLIMDNEIGNANYQLSHNMVYGNTNYDDDKNKTDYNLVIYNYEKSLVYSDYEQELFIIAKDINEKIKNKYQVLDKQTNQLRDIRYSDICIITDRNKYLSEYSKILEYHQIPSVIYMDMVLTNDMVFMVIKNLINLVWNVKYQLFDDKYRYLYTSVARSFLFEYTDQEIYDKLKDKNADDIIKLCYEIDLDKPILEIVNDIFKTFKVYQKLTKLNDIDANIIKLNNLLEICNDITDLGYTLIDFINYLDMVSDNNLAVKYSINTTSDDAVKIMNIHKSKGLEFSLCYFPGFSNHFTIRDVSSKLLFRSELGIIMPEYSDDEYKNTIMRDIFTDMYFKEEVSEKIRLLYVALTRCREKMIIVTSLDGDKEGYHTLVPKDIRLKYRSFLDILNSLDVLSKYTVKVEAECTHAYKQKAFKEIKDNECGIIINKKNIKLEYKQKNNEHFSKQVNKLISTDDANKMISGTKIHKEMEYANFHDMDNPYTKELLKLIDNNFIMTYHEYEFSYDVDGNKYNGIIDLMIEYDKVIYIIDYKLKDITDDEYLKQLKGYKEYIMKITEKNVKTFLYSITLNELKEVLDE